MFISVILQTIVVFLVLIAALYMVKQNRRPYFALLFLIVYIGARLVVRLPQIQDLHPGLHHNWTGQILIVAWVLFCLWISPLTPRDIGLTLRQRPGTVMPAVILTICVIVFKGVLTVLLNAFLVNTGVESLLFQVTMPPLAQELQYSGLLLSLLIVSLGGRQTDQNFDWDRATVLAIIITAFSHGIIFGLVYSSGFQINIIAFTTPFIGKLVYAWLRLSTGSLLFPFLAYSASNFVVWLLTFLLN